MATNERIVVEGLGRLPQFAHAGVTDDLVFVSGTLGTSAGLTLAEGGVGPETAQALRNIEGIIHASGASWDDVVKVSVYLADMDDFAAMNNAYGAWFTGLPPARITIGGVALALGARVEIECVARRPHRFPSIEAARLRRHTGFVDRDGESLYYEVVGEGGVPLVLCHGAGGNHAVWYQQVAVLARRRTVVTWDHRGYGRSTDRAGQSGPLVAADDLLALLDHLEIDRADLVGQSMGGWTVVGAVLARPSLARSLVLADTLGGFTSERISAALAERATGSLPSGEWLGEHPALGDEFAIRAPEQAHLYQMLGQMGTADAAVMLPRLLATSHTEDQAGLLGMPVLCVVGDRDPLFPPRSIRALADLLPDARVSEVSGCGHSPYFEEPAAWNAVVEQFLTDIERRR